MFLSLFQQGFSGLHLQQTLGGRQRGLQAKCQSARGEIPGIRRLKQDSVLFVARGYGKADELQAGGRTDADLAPMRLNAVALFGW